MTDFNNIMECFKLNQFVESKKVVKEDIDYYSDDYYDEDDYYDDYYGNEDNDYYSDDYYGNYYGVESKIPGIYLVDENARGGAYRDIITASYNQLKYFLSDPENSQDTKSTVQWNIMYNGKVFSIYDYYNKFNPIKYPDAIIDWHIGGLTPGGDELAARYLVRKIMNEVSNMKVENLLNSKLDSVSSKLTSEEKSKILDIINNEGKLWSNAPGVISTETKLEYDEDDNPYETYVVELDDSNPTYISSLLDALNKLEKLGIEFDYESNGNGMYGRTYYFYKYVD